MEQALLSYLKEHTEALLAAPSCCKELRGVAEACLAALGTEGEKAAVKALLDEVAADITPIDGLIALTESDMGVSIFGQEQAAAMAAHAHERKDAGYPYCDCPACAACEALLARKDELLG